MVSLPGSAPTVSTLAIGSNPERVRKARRNSDIAVAREGSLRWRRLGGTLGPAAAARSPGGSSIIYKCHWECFSSRSPARPPAPAWSRMWKVHGCARGGEGARVSASERASPCVLTFQCRVRLILHHARGAGSGASGGECADGSPRQTHTPSSPTSITSIT